MDTTGEPNKVQLPPLDPLTDQIRWLDNPAPDDAGFDRPEFDAAESVSALFDAALDDPGLDHAVLDNPVLDNPVFDNAVFDDKPLSGHKVSSRPDATGTNPPGREHDLLAQVDFLDRQTNQYRETLERERIQHSTELAKIQLEIDTRIDGHRREEFERTQDLHESYRALLNERQLEYEMGLAKAAANAASKLEAEQQRHSRLLQEFLHRRNKRDEAARRREISELLEQRDREQQDLVSELDQAASAIKRLQAAVDEATARADQAEADRAAAEVHVGSLETRLAQRSDLENSAQKARHDELVQRVETAERHLGEERARSAATIAEVLERSASLASEIDHARGDFDSDRERLELAASIAKDTADKEYQALLLAADDRAAAGLSREAELEALISELRQEIAARRRLT